LEYKVIRSNRKTLGLSIVNGELIVRATRFTTEKEIQQFIEKNSKWIERNLKKQQEKIDKANSLEAISEDDILKLKKLAKEYIPKRVAYFAPIVGVSYGNITIRVQKTLWGSCTSRGNLSFNCLLMMTPNEVIDSVVVHELCHRKEMNHSKKFYQEVLKVFPEYRKWDKWLKSEGSIILKRVKRNEDENTDSI